MKQTVDFHDFSMAFHHLRPDNFSHQGRAVLYEHLVALEADIGEEFELDVIALCCDYSEDTPQDIAASYRIDLSEVDPDDPNSVFDIVEEWLNDRSVVCGRTDKTIVYCSAF